MSSKTKAVKKVVLAYSGGLDTSIILKWLQQTYGAEVITFTADLGQGGEIEPAREKALMLGIKPENVYIEDLREEFVRDYVFPMFRANALYEGIYLLGTSIARPLIAKKQIDIARATGADAVCHGATGKGNDQVRFELTYYALEPGIKIIAPWREWAVQEPRGSDRLRRTEPDPHRPRTSAARRRSRSTPTCCTPPPRARCWRTRRSSRRLTSSSAPSRPEEAPDKATVITVGFKKGDAVSINGNPLSPANLLATLNDYGRDNGIGRVDLVENRFVGMKSRGIYETPGGTILWHAHRAIESITLDRGAMHLKDELMPRYAELIYLRLLVLARARDAAGGDRQEPGARRGRGAPQALQGQRDRHRPRERQVALLLDARHLRGRQGRLRPEGCGGLHQAQRAAPAHACHAHPEELEPSAPNRSAPSKPTSPLTRYTGRT